MKKIALIITVSTLFFCGCRGKVDDENYTVDTTTEAAQQVGDVMASLDESGGATDGEVASHEVRSYQKAYARMSAGEQSKSEIIFKAVFPMAEAAACNTIAFATCSAGKKTKDVTGCTTAGGGTMSGNITLSFTGSGAGTCTLPNATDAVTRAPNYEIKGLRGATFAVKASSTGQTLTRAGASTFTFSSSGIRRSFVTPGGSTLLDITSTTGSEITVTGNSRNSRTMSGGSIILRNNLTAESCTLVPTDVAWTNSCNCPTSGSWSGTCSDSTSYSVAFGSTCGSATVTKGSVTNTIVLDRCQQ
jgi:hypothetical protein